MGPKKTAVLFSRKLFLYTVNLAPPGGKFKFLILFCLLKLPGALDQKSCLMQSKAESNSAQFEGNSISVLGLSTNFKFGGAKWKWPSFLTPSGHALASMASCLLRGSKLVGASEFSLKRLKIYRFPSTRLVLKAQNQPHRLLRPRRPTPLTR